MINTDTKDAETGKPAATEDSSKGTATQEDEHRAPHGASASQAKSEPSTESAPHAKTLHIRKPLGHVAITALICGLAGALVAVVLDFIHAYDAVVIDVKTTYASKPFYLEDTETWLRPWDWLIAFLLSWAVAFVTLDSAGWGRRVFIGVVTMLLVTIFSPLLMLWGVLWLPVAEIVAISFALLFALIYTSQHVMPCELGTRMKKVKQPRSERAIKNRKKQVHSDALKSSQAYQELDTSKQEFPPLTKKNPVANSVEKSTNAST